jgi:hypothetical protein
LHWKGAESLPEILRRLRARERVLLNLPAGFHHALSVAASRHDAPSAPLDVGLDEAGFERLVRIAGLRELAELRAPLAANGMTMRIRTPPPQILFLPRERGVRRNAHDLSITEAALV